MTRHHHHFNAGTKGMESCEHFRKMPDPYLDHPCDQCGKTMRQSVDGFEFTPEGKVTCRTCWIKGVPKETMEKVKELLSKK